MSGVKKTAIMGGKLVDVVEHSDYVKLDADFNTLGGVYQELYAEYEKLKEENAALQHDIERHLTICSELATENERLRADAEKHKLSLLDRECLRIGQQIQRAAGDLPLGYGLKINLELHAGTLSLFDRLGDAVKLTSRGEGLSFDIADAIDAALKKGGEDA